MGEDGHESAETDIGDKIDEIPPNVSIEDAILRLVFRGRIPDRFRRSDETGQLEADEERTMIRQNRTSN